MLINELQAKCALLDKAIEQVGPLGKAYAKAKMDYGIATAQMMLKERDKGTPVTIMSDLCKGDKYVAQKRFERDVAEVTYKAALEAINNYKLQIRILDNQIQMEYNS